MSMQEKIIFIHEQAGGPEWHKPFLGGQLVLFTARSPDKETSNEDAAGAFAVDNNNGLLVVADGLGGLPMGKDASGTAIRALDRALHRCGDNGTSMRDCVLNGIEAANKEIMEQGAGSATTLAAVEVSDHTIRPYHIGDSMILVCGQRGKMKFQTISHSPVGYAVESGMLDEHEAMHHEERHIVSNFIGGSEMRIEIGPALELAPRDTLLIASDGLSDNIHVNEIIELVRKGPLVYAVKQLVRICHERMKYPDATQPSKPDDLTILLYRPV